MRKTTPEGIELGHYGPPGHMGQELMDHARQFGSTIGMSHVPATLIRLQDDGKQTFMKWDMPHAPDYAERILDQLVEVGALFKSKRRNKADTADYYVYKMNHYTRQWCNRAIAVNSDFLKEHKEKL